MMIGLCPERELLWAPFPGFYQWDYRVRAQQGPLSPNSSFNQKFPLLFNFGTGLLQLLQLRSEYLYITNYMTQFMLGFTLCVAHSMLLITV